MNSNTTGIACACEWNLHLASNSHSSVAKNDSHIALSKQSPTEPIDGRTPASRQREPNSIDVYCLSIRYTERLAEAGIEPSVGSRGDSYDNALAESVIGLFKAGVTHRLGPWKGIEDVEFATLDWVSWFNGSRLLEPLGYVPPIEFEEAYYRQNGLPPENGFAGSTQSHDRASA